MNLPGWIKQIDETSSPLSCRCYIIKGRKGTWIFDVGANENALREINSIEGEKNIVLSHFHQDHISNIAEINADNIYQGGFTFRHTGKGTVIDKSTVFEDGYVFRIFPLPNIHAKGSLAMEVNGYVFLGDGVYPAMKNGHYCYNAPLLKEEIDVLKNCSGEYFVDAHGADFIRTKDEVTGKLEKIYSQRNPKETYIIPDDMPF